MENFMSMYVLGSIFYLILTIISASYFHEIAVMKGHTESRYFWLPLLLPIMGCLLVVALPDRNPDNAKINTQDFSSSTTVTNDELPEI